MGWMKVQGSRLEKTVRELDYKLLYIVMDKEKEKEAAGNQNCI